MYLSAFWIITAVVMVIFWLSGFYGPARSYPIRLKAMMVAEAATFAFVIVGMVAFVAGDAMDLPRSVLIMAWTISSFSLWLRGSGPPSGVASYSMKGHPRTLRADRRGRGAWPEG